MRSNEHILQYLKIPSQALEAVSLLCPLCSGWHGDLHHRQDSDTVTPNTQAIFALRNLSAVCKPAPALNSRFPPVRKRKTFARKPIVIEPSLTPLLCKENTPGTWPQHSHPCITSSCFERKWQDTQWATVGAGRKAWLARQLKQVVLQVKR